MTKLPLFVKIIISRIRTLLITCILLGIITLIFVPAKAGGFSPDDETSSLKLAVFDVDATPPIGSYMAYGRAINTWVMSLRARGIVLLGAGQPIVLCSVDWIGIANDSQDEFKKAMAEAAGTIPDRVVVHTVHQHDAPICDFSAEKFLKDAGIDPLAYESSFTRKVMNDIAGAIRSGMKTLMPFNQIGLGEAHPGTRWTGTRHQVHLMQGLCTSC
jgi:hypothetical protein